MKIKNCLNVKICISSGGYPEWGNDEPDYWVDIEPKETVEVEQGFLDNPYVQIEEVK